MANKDKSEEKRQESAPGVAWLMGALGWFLPGAGHVLQGRWGRGLLLGGAVWVMFIVGVLFGGHLFSFTAADTGTNPFLQAAPAIANLGTGGLYLFCSLLGLNFAELPEQMRRATFEYGNTFLWVAGLLNYLAMLDAFDIAAGRKS
ncbi:MAG: hypothetical protein ICV60_08225 [Pyrinomonadaceae bacterium]|nr:hypothetical protein [Pyrinomonadaceae bacterium]